MFSNKYLKIIKIQNKFEENSKNILIKEFNNLTKFNNYCNKKIKSLKKYYKCFSCKKLLEKEFDLEHFYKCSKEDYDGLQNIIEHRDKIKDLNKNILLISETYCGNLFYNYNFNIEKFERDGFNVLNKINNYEEKLKKRKQNNL